MHRLAAVVGRRDAFAALGTALVTLVLLFVLPVLVALAGDTASPHPAEPGWWWLVALFVLQSVTVAAARSFPVVAVLAVAGLPLLAVWLARGDGFGLTSLPVMVTVYLAAVSHPLPRLRAGLTAAVLLFGAGYAANQLLDPAGIGPGPAVAAALLQAVLVVGGPLVIALLVAARRAAREAHREELRALAGERDAIIQAAIATQRTTMARELHDIAAHHLSGLSLMAAAVDLQIDTDPSAARAGVQQIRAQSSLVLDDLRRLVGLLREEDDDEGPATLAAVPELVQQFSTSEHPIELTVRAPDAGMLGADLGPAAHLTGYRMVQESLANTQLHAAGAARSVELDDRGENTVVITVRNGPAEAASPPGRDGFGLRGMHERAELIGAELSYGPVVDGGWQVELTIPRTSAQEAT
ncbi:sensor histidine kinase [Ruania zhangjianzhongii]|nr:histidine kinase [Ruania zhangjianzhongii]